MIVEGEKVTFKDIPVDDAPAFIADKSLLNGVLANH